MVEMVCYSPVNDGVCHSLTPTQNEKWKTDFSPIDTDGVSFVDSDYSKAYLRHLFISKEMLGPMICSNHNLAFYLWLVTEARKHIIEGDFVNWKNQMVKQLQFRL